MAARPENAGILAMECYFPQVCVPQTALEESDGCAGKYTVGLGQHSLSLFDDREDVGSVLMTAVANLMDKYGIKAEEVGRLEVGTETLIDKSKSIKTAILAQLFGECADIEGVTSTNACYGGTAALFNSVAWVESSAWDGRYAIVVCGDIAVYAPGPARPTGGGGAVAMLIGADAPLALIGPRATRAVEVYDFYKPSGTTEYASVDGKLSQSAYIASVDVCWAGLKKKLTAAGEASPTLDSFDYVCMHSPYNKLVQKGFARFLAGDFADDPDKAEFADEAVQAYRAKPPQMTVDDRGAEKLFMGLAQERFGAKCAPGDFISKRTGNCYTAALYMNLLSLVSHVGAALEGKRLLLFSYGSGAVATAFCVHARAQAGTEGGFSVARIAESVRAAARLEARTVADVKALADALQLRELSYGKAGWTPQGPVKGLAPGTFYLEAVDEEYRRSYGRVPV